MTVFLDYKTFQPDNGSGENVGALLSFPRVGVRTFADVRSACVCTTPQVFESGMCGCLGYDLFQGDDWQTIYYNSTINFDDVLSEYDDDTKRSVVAAVCASTIHDGDHLTVSCARPRVIDVRSLSALSLNPSCF